MSITRNSFRRPAALFAAAALLVGTAVPALLGNTAYAAGQVSSRFIQLSDASPSGNATITSGVGSGTNVTYKVGFTAATATNIGGIVVDVCDNTPLIGDTSCTYPTGFDWGGATPSVTVNSGLSGTWTAAGVQAGAGAGDSQVLRLSNASPETPSGAVQLTVTGVTNPDTSTLNATTHQHTFFARILTFDTSGNMTSNYTISGTTRAAAPMTGNVDNGGVAMSLSQVITVTARVMETLALCASSVVYTDVACAGPTGTDVPSIILGHGPNNVLDTSAIDTDAIYTQVSTNASNGYSLYLRASNSCAGLSKDGGTTCGIPAVGSPAGSATGATITAGTAAFGASVGDGAAVGTGTGSNTATARWKTTPPAYIMDNTTGSDNVGYTYGSMIASSAGQANGVMNTITFAATASPTTPAGIYSENFTLVGVGTF